MLLYNMPLVVFAETVVTTNTEQQAIVICPALEIVKKHAVVAGQIRYTNWKVSL